MGGGPQEDLSSVCQSVCHKNLTGKPGFLEPENHSFCSLALQNSEFWLAKISASCAAPELAKGNFNSLKACVSAAEWLRLARGTLLAIYAENRSKRGVPPWPGARGRLRGRKKAPKWHRWRPQKRLPDQCGGWKSDEVLHFFRASHREFVGVGGRAHGPPRATIFLREGGGSPAGFVLRLSVTKIRRKKRVFEARKSLILLIGT